MLFAQLNGRAKGNFGQGSRHITSLRDRTCALKCCFDDKSLEPFLRDAAHMYMYHKNVERFRHNNLSSHVISYLSLHFPCHKCHSFIIKFQVFGGSEICTRQRGLFFSHGLSPNRILFWPRMRTSGSYGPVLMIHRFFLRYKNPFASLINKILNRLWQKPLNKHIQPSDADGDKYTSQ